MSSAPHHRFAPAVAPVRAPFPGNPVGSIAPVKPGTFAPGTKVQVGSHRVVIVKYLSEGGFAHVYHVRLPKPINGDDGAVLKRVAVPDKDALASMRTEVETMKKLKGHRHIVTYIDSHASQLKGGGYEVFLLMEYCAGGGLIDFMNTRLQNRLTEPEILKIFADVAEGVAYMHYLKPPLLHRDLKVENILIGSSRRYKLCDFGSTASPRPAATSAAEGRLIEDDVQKHTTLQYRSPEMIDVYRKQPIDEKSDIWALGVLLYKLCYYTTPFEEQGQMAILNASFKFPGHPAFSDRLKKLVASMLRENPQQRPNIYQVVRDVSLMRGTDVPIRDIYTGRTASESRRNQALPSPEPKVSSPPLVGAYKASHVEEKTQIPDIMPMRRGRPTKGKSEHSAPKPSPSPARGNSSDPFAALDSASNTAPSLLADSASFDQASSRFPPLDEFSLLHDSGTKFAFEAASNAENGQPSLHRELSKRVTEALADDAFAPRIEGKKSSAQPQTIPPTADHSTPSLSRPSGQSSMKITKPQTIQQPAPQRSAMVSTGTMTSPSPPQSSHGLSSQSARPIFRFPPSPEPRSASLSRNADTSPVTRPNPSARDPSNNPRPGLLDHRSKSQLGLGSLTGSNSSASSRPSLEGQRPSMLDLDNTVNRSKSTNSRVRPSSALVETTTKLLRRRESSRSRAMTDLPKPASDAADSLVAAKTGDSDGCEEPSKISSNVEFLRAMEEEDPGKRKEKRSSSGSKHIKRSSMPSISLSGTKNLLAGRFGEAFRRFETNNGPNNRESSPSPNDRESSELTPIAGSEATDGRSDDGQVVEETEPIPAEVRRELERRRLSQEEKRVTDGAAAYKQRVAKGADNDREGSRGRESNRAASIQSKVQSLLDENGKSSPTKTAEGCGRFTNHPHRNQEQFTTPLQYTNAQPVPQEAAYTSVDVKRAGPSHFSKTSSKPDMPGPSARSAFVAPISAPQSSTTDRPYSPRPTAPPKPQALRTGMTGSKVTGDPLGQTKSLGGGSRTAPSSSTIPSTSTFQNHHSNVINADDWEEKFSQRYPKLSGLELVETEIDKRTGEV